mmetsp:Transcript_24673/g.77909  ORF Transcript_24673/g.77909 Transcript_24673/m.77909 type:complete len:224 (+) Transcript_24673:1322-1993(+)
MNFTCQERTSPVGGHPPPSTFFPTRVVKNYARLHRCGPGGPRRACYRLRWQQQGRLEAGHQVQRRRCIHGHAPSPDRRELERCHRQRRRGRGSLRWGRHHLPGGRLVRRQLVRVWVLPPRLREELLRLRGHLRGACHDLRGPRRGARGVSAAYRRAARLFVFLRCPPRDDSGRVRGLHLRPHLRWDLRGGLPLLARGGGRRGLHPRVREVRGGARVGYEEVQG